jgi:hypothetical protein
MEYRPIEIRAASTGRRLTGYAASYNTRTEIRSKGFTFVEEIAPGAFRKILATNPDVLATWNHLETALPLGRTTAGTLKLSEDSRGLAFDIDLPDTQFANDLHAACKRGDINGASFAFAVGPGDEEWSEDTVEGRSTQVRTLRNFSGLYDISVVARPAYQEGTSVVARGEISNGAVERRFSYMTGRKKGFRVTKEEVAAWHLRSGHETLEEFRARGVRGALAGAEIVRRRKALLNSILND